MRPTVRSILPLLALVSAAAAGESPVPYGHADFYPTAERPAQLRGDGTGHFPAATPVRTWDFRTGENIVWRTMLPGWGYSSPIVVGDKVFVTCDWNKLVCVDARTGRVTWVRTNETYDTVGGGKAEELRALFEKFTGDWLEAWQCCWEIAYLTWKLDVIEAARSAEAAWPDAAYGHTGRVRKGGGSIPPDHLSEAEQKAVLAKAASLPDAEVQGMRSRLSALEAKREANQWGPNVSAYVPRLSPYVRGSENEGAYKKEIGKALKQLTPHGLFTDFWNGWMSTSFPTPASDGAHVYVMFSQCQVACYDLEGNRKWLRVFTEDAVTARLDQNYSASPILAGDKLIVIFGGRENKENSWTRIRALDKATGEVLWSRKQPFVCSSHSFPQVVRVKHEGVDAIATGAGAILRTADGRPIIENLPAPIAPPLVHENEVYITCGAGEASGGGARMKVVLTGQGRDLAAKVAWGHLPEKHKSVAWFRHASEHFPDAPLKEFPYKSAPQTVVGCLWDNGRILYGDDPRDMVDAATGEALTPPDVRRDRLPGKAGRGHLVRAGDVLIGTASGTVVRVHDLADPAKILAVNHVGSEYHRRIQLLEMSAEEAVKAIRDLPWLPHANDWAIMQTTPWPQGDRLYIRAKDTLWCIGDPEDTQALSDKE